MPLSKFSFFFSPLSTSRSALGPPPESLWFLPLASFLPVSDPSSCPSCCLLLFPLAILLIVLPTCSVAPSTLCFFSEAFLPPSGFSPFQPSHCPYFCFLPSLLSLLSTKHLWSDLQDKWNHAVVGQQGNKHREERLGGGTDWSVCWHHAARLSSGSSALPFLFCWKDGCPCW